MVTGVTEDGIGGATCRRLVADARRRGDRIDLAVCATGTRPGFAGFVHRLGADDVRAVALTGDLADPDVPARLVGQAVETFGGLDLLVSNAGIARRGSLVELSLEDWEILLDTHARAAWLLAKAAHPALREARGAMVAVGSTSGTFPHAGQGGYAVAKAALIMLCQTLAMEWAPDVRVNVVSPGLVKTPLSVKAYEDPAREAWRAAATPLGRIGAPDEIADVVAFLAGPDARFITGENLLVDGGLIRSSLNQIAYTPAAT
jgi:glucose 1-dehydrogenase